jgi:hypothetical protein
MDALDAELIAEVDSAFEAARSDSAPGLDELGVNEVFAPGGIA